MRIPRRAGLASALLASVLAIAACGGDDEDEVTVSADELVPSKRDYIVQADTVCANSEQGIQTEAEAEFRIGAKDFTITPSGEIVFKAGRRPSDERIRAFGSEVVVPAFREQVADLRALTPPEGDEREVAAIYDAADAGIDELGADPSLFSDPDAVRAKLDEARRLGRSYGFFNCGTYSGP